MLKQRIMTAVVLIPLVVLAIFGLQLEVFGMLVGAVILLAAWEWTGFIHQLKTWQRLGYLVATFGVMLLVMMNSLPMSFWHGWVFPAELADWFRLSEASLWLIVIGCIWWLIAFMLVLIFPRISQTIIHKPLIMLLIGWLILLPTWVAITGLRSISYEVDVYRGGSLLIFSLALIWAADVGAYFAGKTFGRIKLAPHVSPKKTWEGVIGGILLAAVIGFVGLYFLKVQNFSMWIVALIAVMVLSSVVGDLTESIFKRLSNTKDSGHILPGHGGILDRIDGLTAAMPFCLLGFAILGIR